ncbi:alpha/beta hydrolase [Lichenibacterium ramalinae]|uniref:Alpha/beta hydrolase n=1 Tax=Lichenibacterium ramalinae TaxID=2316527 RepID=A0A4Q2R9H4_9HYPH|nr:alpha/beta hydrolase [Lichenibacterium ramalinae]RYB03585.1 alpha/beta hydrolase [Lichenibacterium ramalinae]
MPAQLRAATCAMACAAALLAAAAAQAQTPAVAQDFQALEAAQNLANGAPGPRAVPSKSIPVPGDVDGATQALIAAPYRTPAWDADPADAAAWHALVDKLAQAALPGLAKARAALGVTLEPVMLGGVKGFVLTPREVPEAHRGQVIYNIHGGGYVYGPGESGTAEAMLMAAIGGYKVVAVDYRMPPDAPYPAAMDDADAGYRAVIADTDPKKVAVVGTSTGGGMTLALMLRLKAEGVALPGAIAPGTPWADLTETGDTYKTNEWVDNVLVSYSGYLSHAAQLYAAGHDLKDPQLSPIYGDFHGLPPTILTSGTRDLFLSNIVRTQQKLREAGVVQELQVYEGLSHAQYLFDPAAPVTRDVFGEITRFLDGHLAR